MLAVPVQSSSVVTVIEIGTETTFLAILSRIETAVLGCLHGVS